MIQQAEEIDSRLQVGGGSFAQFRRAAAYFGRAAEVLGSNPEAASYLRRAGTLIYAQDPAQAAVWLSHAAEIAHDYGDVQTAINDYREAAHSLMLVRRPRRMTWTAPEPGSRRRTGWKDLRC
jgi:hypothetical protein